MRNFLFTSESVSEGHPDKVADQISDAVLDAFLSGDSNSRVACETMISTGFVMLAGEITSKVQVDISTLVRKTLRDIGYTNSEIGFDADSCAVQVALDRQSQDIARGVDSSDQREQGAGDQGIMFGYAVNETPEYMPLTISLAHKLVRELASLRKSGRVPFLRPDSKSQVTVEYINGKAARIDSIVLSTQHSPDVDQATIKSFVQEELIPRVVPREFLDAGTRFFVNPTGRFVVGGPLGDCGLTGRKIIVDTYGGHGAHGGGAFSGKDPSKVDRSAAYAARHVAKNIVAAVLADRVLVQLAYAIGVAEPVSVMVNDYGTGKVSSEILSQAVREVWNLKPAEIVKQFDLLKPRYLKTAAYGHFGRNKAEFTWEKTDKVEAIKDAVKALS
ncbi:MAG: methionine adenosyltransferase [Bdellovibrionales bacterium]|nr:methionine adenosyltransferase [Bdellovibrionales bacterium]